MSAQQPVVFVVDDDASVREALKNLFRSVALEVQTFETAQDFLASPRPDRPACLVLDVRLPGMGGLDLQRQLADANIGIPIIFITAHGDIPMSVKAMKAGAAEFLTKPFNNQELLDAVQAAIERDTKARARQAVLADLQTRYKSLSGREQDVMGLVVRGLLNKQIAGELSISEATVKLHRRNMMEKMGAETFADLVKMAQSLGLAKNE